MVDLLPLPEAPPIFREMALHFHQDIEFQYPAVEEAIDTIQNVVSGADRIEQMGVLRAYLQTLIDGPYSDQQLQRQWTKTGSDVYFSGDGTRKFYRLVIDRLARQAASNAPPIASPR